jgi:hypothetical protein
MNVAEKQLLIRQIGRYIEQRISERLSPLEKQISGLTSRLADLQMKQVELESRDKQPRIRVITGSKR